MGIDKLISKSVTFNSPKVDGLKMINEKLYPKTPLNPRIETHKIINPNGNSTEFISKKFDNGGRFELYRFPDEVIKLIKNKYGELKSFKSSIAQHNEKPQRTYEKAKSAMEEHLKGFLA